MKQKKQAKRTRRSGLLIGIILLALLFGVGMQLYRMQDQLQAARDQEAALTQQVAALEDKNQELADAIENSDDPELIEEIARTELGMVTRDEKVFYDISN